MKQNFVLAIFIFCSFSLFAQTTETKEEISKDPLDVSIQKEQIEKYGVPTLSTVEEMKNKADALYNSQSWEEAAAAYEVYAKHVNWLANLLTQCVEPYYSASYDDRKATPYSKLKTFIPLESKANECKTNRNHAYVKMGLCYKNIGDIKNAVTYLYKGLDLVDVEDMEYWTLAKDAMVEILEFKGE
jgi:tetratricopeptide (TPR) repeat protein